MCDMGILFLEGFTLVPHHHGREFHERFGGNGVLGWFLLLFWVEREETRGDGAYQSLSTLLLLHEARRFLENIATMKTPLFFRFSDGLLLACSLAIIAPLSDVPLLSNLL